MLKSDTLDNLLMEKRPEAVADAADGIQHDWKNDGDSPDRQIYERGIELAEHAAEQGKPIVQLWDGHDHYLYIIGTKEEVAKKLEALPDKQDGDPTLNEIYDE